MTISYNSDLEMIVKISDPRRRLLELESLRMRLYVDYKDDTARAILRGQGKISIPHEIAVTWEQIRARKVSHASISHVPTSISKLPFDLPIQTFFESDEFWGQ